MRDPWGIGGDTSPYTSSFILGSLGPDATGFGAIIAPSYVLGARATFAAPRPDEFLTEIPFERLVDWPGRAYAVRGLDVRFSGTAADWSTVTGVILNIDNVQVTDPAVGTLSDVFYLPAESQDALAARVAEMFALRLNNTPVSTEQPDLSQLIRLDVSGFSMVAAPAEAAIHKRITRRANLHNITTPNGVEFEP